MQENRGQPVTRAAAAGPRDWRSPLVLSQVLGASLPGAHAHACPSPTVRGRGAAKGWYPELGPRQHLLYLPPAPDPEASGGI